jgi:hypothetical protein
MPMQLVDVHSRIYSALISSKYSFQQLYDQDISLVEDMDFYRILMSDAGFGAIIRVFYAEIAASGVMFQPGGVDKRSAKKARKVASILKKAPIQECIYGLAKGFIMARAYAYPEGRRILSSHDGGQPRSYWTVTDIKDIDKQRFILVPEKIEVPDPARPGFTKRIVKVHRQMSRLDTGQYEPLSKEYAAALIEFVCGDEEDRLGMGRGLAEALYMLLRAKAMLWKFRLQGISRWAEGVLVGTVDPDRPASPSKNNLSLAQDLLSKLRNMRDGNVIVVPEGLADVKALESNGTGDDMTARAMDYCDDCAARLLLGSIMPSGGNKGAGTEARGRVEADTTKRVIQYCRHLITSTLNRTLVRTVCRLNREQFLEDECLDGEDPVIKIVDNQATDPETVLDRIEKAQKMKMKVPKAWAHEVSEIPMPSDDEEVLEEVEVAGLTGMGGSNDQSALNPGKEDPGGNGTPFEKTGDRQDEKKKGEDYALRKVRDDEIKELIATYAARIERLEQSLSRAQATPPAPIVPIVPIAQPSQVVVNIPPPRDYEDARKREEDLKQQLREREAAYAAEKERPIEFHVHPSPAPDVRVTVEAAKAPDVTVNPVINVAPSPAPEVTVQAPPPANITVEIPPTPSGKKSVSFDRDKDGKIKGATIVPEKPA